MSEVKVLSIILAIVFVLGLSVFLYCKEVKDNYPQETFPVPTYIPEETTNVPEETTTIDFVPSPEPSIPTEEVTIPEEGKVSISPAETIVTESTKETTPADEEPVEEVLYPEAQYIWDYLTQTLGYNNYVAAGIMGNILVECGGEGMTVKWWSGGWNTGYYGMCQWSLKYRPETYGMNLEQQCDYLRDTIQPAFDDFGPLCYKKGFNYEKFIQMEDAEEAAYAFAKCFERCANTPYNYQVRKVKAVEAYNYFANETA